jgi:hypothetical protein
MQADAGPHLDPASFLPRLVERFKALKSLGRRFEGAQDRRDF